MKKLLVELLWVLTGTLLTSAISFMIFRDTLFNGMPLELQLHDTYFIFSKSLIVVVIFLILLPSLYLMRMVYKYSNNKTINALLICLFGIVLYGLLQYWNWTLNLYKDHGYYLINLQNQVEQFDEFTLLHWLLPIFIIINICMLVLFGFKIIKASKKLTRAK